MRVLVACEFSGIVRDAFRALGHDAWSCDLLPTEVEGPHIQGDVLKHLSEGWDLMIAHPPCTYLSLAGNVWLKQPGRLQKREQAMRFFLALFGAPIGRVAVENPPGYPYRAFRRPDQCFHPYHFGHPMRKKTCLWLRGLDLLLLPHPEAQEPPPVRHDGKRNRHWTDLFGGGEKRRRTRSRTFQRIADAMAEQWGGIA